MKRFIEDKVRELMLSFMTPEPDTTIRTFKYDVARKVLKEAYARGQCEEACFWKGLDADKVCSITSGPEAGKGEGK